MPPNPDFDGSMLAALAAAALAEQQFLAGVQRNIEQMVTGLSAEFGGGNDKLRLSELRRDDEAALVRKEVLRLGLPLQGAALPANGMFEMTMDRQGLFDRQPAARLIARSFAAWSMLNEMGELAALDLARRVSAWLESIRGSAKLPTLAVALIGPEFDEKLIPSSNEELVRLYWCRPVDGGVGHVLCGAKLTWLAWAALTPMPLGMKIDWAREEVRKAWGSLGVVPIAELCRRLSLPEAVTRILIEHVCRRDGQLRIDRSDRDGTLYVTTR